MAVTTATWSMMSSPSQSYAIRSPSCAPAAVLSDQVIRVEVARSLLTKCIVRYCANVATLEGRGFHSEDATIELSLVLDVHNSSWGSPPAQRTWLAYQEQSCSNVTPAQDGGSK